MIRQFIITIFSLFALASTVQGQSVDYKGKPWVARTSRPYTANNGLEGRHLSLWSSHGRYFEAKKNAWLWQRPYLFCTTEDMLTQSFVNPFLIPMLEKAGAVVYTPKERDTQTNEAIVDNDSPDRYGSYSERGQWSDAGRGFGFWYDAFNDTIQPFKLGSVRSAAAGKDASATWMPQIPETGDYAVYVSYATLPNSIDDAHYTVYHAGGTSTFSVNQQMGGGTWVYLGTFRFEAGQNERGRVVLSTKTSLSGTAPDGQPYAVTADAVRFGGGCSLVERSTPTIVQTTVKRKGIRKTEAGNVEVTYTDTINSYKYGKGVKSGLPRYLEAARYNTQFSGLADSLYNRGNGFNDYNDDLRARSYMINRLAGGSVYIPDTIGARVPLELQLALHTDAGWNKADGIIGTLTIATPNDDEGRTTYRSGLTREAANTLANSMLKGVGSDLSVLYNLKWTQRELRIQNYAETRSPLVPATILELLSHQNFRDMTFAHDPNFKFMASRAMYKVLLREVYHNHDLGEPTVQPLPVRNVSATIDSSQPYAYTGPLSKASVTLSWEATEDPLEPTAMPTDYIVYYKEGNDDWDEGTLTEGKNSLKMALVPGELHQFRITALNAGGESFPSQVVSVYAAPSMALAVTGKKPKGCPTILLVNDFDRLSGPARIDTSEKAGFDLRRDVGVSYGNNCSLAGPQTVFSRSEGGKEGSAALGYCTDEYVGKSIAGNHYDDVSLHAADILSVTTDYSIVSMTRSAFDELSIDAIKRYEAIDFIAGLQADKSYNLVHYDVFTPQTRKLLAEYMKKGGKLFVSGAFIGEPAASLAGKQQKANIAESDSVFLAQVLHCNYRATINHSERTTFSGLGIDIPVFNVPGPVHYACQESTVLEAQGKDAFPAFAYAPNSAGNGYAAGVAWPSGVVMGFPYDCISDPNTRRIVMNAVLNYLLK